MGSTTMRVLSHENIAATEDRSKVAREGRILSVKDVLVILSIFCVSAVPIGAMIVAALSEIELPPFLRELLIQPFPYM